MGIYESKERKEAISLEEPKEHSRRTEHSILKLITLVFCSIERPERSMDPSWSGVSYRKKWWTGMSAAAYHSSYARLGLFRCIFDWLHVPSYIYQVLEFGTHYFSYIIDISTPPISRSALTRSRNGRYQLSISSRRICGIKGISSLSSFLSYSNGGWRLSHQATRMIDMGIMC